MNRAQLYLIAILCAVSLRKFVGAEKVEEGHRDSHHEKDYLHHRTKRYSMDRAPLFLYKRAEGDDSYGLENRYRSNLIPTNPVASHFREVQGRQAKRPSPVVGEDNITPSQLQAYRNFIQYSGRNGNADLDEDIDLGIPGIGESQVLPQAASGIGPMSDAELQTLLALLEEYRLQGKSAPLRNYYSAPSQYFSPEMAGPAKRETGKRSSSNRGPLVLEQPMSFENSVADNYPVFLTQKRSKRVGNLALKPKSMSTTRIKKATDPAVEAELDKIFAETNSATDQQQAENHTSRHSTSIPTTPISSSGQIPPPSSSQKKPIKKTIDWSEYFGIDKRQENQKHASTAPGDKTPPLQQDAINHNMHNAQNTDQEAIHQHHTSEESDKTITTTTTGAATASSAAANVVGASRDASPSSQVKDKKAKKEKEASTKKENDADDKADADRKWILKEFYKNLAMSTNVKRKRESPAIDPRTDLDKLEKIERKMEEAGDQIIWDALKYTGAHKDAELSPDELAHVKKEIIQKLAAAYSLEKVREAIEEFRQQLGQLKDKQQHY